MEKKTNKWVRGEQVTVYLDSLTMKRPEAVFTLIERQEPIPTINEYSLNMWLVEFDDGYGEKHKVRRPILEVGNVNLNITKEEDFTLYQSEETRKKIEYRKEKERLKKEKEEAKAAKKIIKAAGKLKL